MAEEAGPRINGGAIHFPHAEQKREPSAFDSPLLLKQPRHDVRELPFQRGQKNF
jgi:hypothetical protein